MRGDRDLGIAPAVAAPSRARCYLCPRVRDRKTMQKCLLCAKPACFDHSVTSRFCDNCKPE